MSQGFDLKGSYYSYINKDTIPSVFIHGVGLDHQMWKPQINSLNEFSTLTALQQQVITGGVATFAPGDRITVIAVDPGTGTTGLKAQLTYTTS